MKYIIFRSPEGPRAEIFAAPTTHADQARAHRDWKPISAGFVTFLGQGEVRCYGYSDSLNLGPAQSDDSLIEVMMSATLSLAPAPTADAING
jgi:hypothetical protein